MGGRGGAAESSNDSLTYNHQRELKSFLHRLAMNLIRQVGESHIPRGLGVGQLPLPCSEKHKSSEVKSSEH